MGGKGVLTLLKGLYKERKGIPILGITGLPGAGKSTLIDQLLELLRKQGKTVGVLAIDPSSPFSGGALLGDRIRMQRHASDDGVFIRSMGSRGAHGGLSKATRNCLIGFDAYGFDQIILETVGVGQTELDIMGLVETTVVVLMPDSGDAIQTLKAGLTEIADIFVVNKSDREGAGQLQTLLKAMTHEEKGERAVLLTQADKGVGISELWESVGEHRKNLKSDPLHLQHQKKLRQAQFLDLVGEVYKEEMIAKLLKDKKSKKILDQIGQGKLNPFEALENVLKFLSKPQ